MLKKSLLIGLSTSILLMSGCAAKPQAKVAKFHGHQTVYIEINNGAGSPSYGSNETESFKDALQTAAQITLDKGYKYFAILSPKEISTLQGSLANTAEDLLKHCSHNGFNAFNVPGTGLHKCGTFNTNARMGIALYQEEQNDFLVINAQEVIDYLKAHDLYEDKGLDLKDFNVVVGSLKELQNLK